MKTNINTELFKRYAPKKKIEIINNLTQEELLATTPATLIRVVKEAGTKCYKSRDKELRIRRSLRKGNSWNSSFDGVETVKGKLMALFTIEYSNTDTSDGAYFSEFMRGERFRGTIKTTDRYGNPQTYYYFYDDEDRAACIRSILLEYVYTKYADKLNPKND